MLYSITYTWPVSKYGAKSCTFLIELDEPEQKPKENKLEQNIKGGS